MAYNEDLAQRIRLLLYDKDIAFREKAMFGGLCFLVDDKMLCGTHTDKKDGSDVLLCRIGTAAHEQAAEHPDCLPMDFNGKPMKGYVYVIESGFRTRQQLDYWLQQCLDFNPLATKSRK